VTETVEAATLTRSLRIGEVVKASTIESGIRHHRSFAEIGQVLSWCRFRIDDKRSAFGDLQNHAAIDYR
jgi:hypothetical protein